MEQAERKAISVTLNPRARQVIEGIRGDSGVPNTEAMARILEWFAALDRKLRLSVLTRDVGTQREMLTLLLQQMVAADAATKEHGPLALLDLDQLLALQTQVGHHIGERAKTYRMAASVRPKPGRDKS